MLRNVYIALVIMYWSDDYHHYAKALDYNVPNMEMEKDQDYWYSLAKDNLDYALNKKIIENIAKNVIIFVGDGYLSIN
ncbi:hypothetical protein Anas_10854 [Armadillidium nasatum]|uniref:Alkaline phosphatase n=1 Tax=Armadillidium nasatum TaxID=96803 RepID=A0A5N5SSR7_9CRUS|nr:hypothetical protein Anas_10854 [Armadillidium nasatum]